MRSILVVGLLVGSVFSQLSFAETVYIRDTIYVPLRGGQSSEHRILHKGIASGTALELLEVNDDTGFSQVRTASGMQGWIQKILNPKQDSTNNKKTAIKNPKMHWMPKLLRKTQV